MSFYDGRSIDNIDVVAQLQATIQAALGGSGTAAL
jgi:hypothetical protein